MAITTVAGSFIRNYTNFTASQSLTINRGSGSDGFVCAVAQATNGDGSGSRSITSASYGGVGISVSSVFANQFGKFCQLVYGATSLTGSNALVANATNNSGEIVMAGCAFDGVDQTTPVSGIVQNDADSASPSFTVSSATGDTVVALFQLLTGEETFTPGTGTTAIGPWVNNFQHGGIEDGASSVTIGGTLGGTQSWSGFGFSLLPASGGASAFIPIIGRGPGLALAGGSGLVGRQRRTYSIGRAPWQRTHAGLLVPAHSGAHHVHR